MNASALHDATNYFRVGQIAGTHALKGEVRVFPQTDDRERFTKGLQLFLEDARGQVRELVVERSRQNGKFVLVKFKGLDSIDDVERFRGGTLFVDRKDAIPLEEGEYFVADLIGLAVYEEDGTLLGELTDVIETGANDVYAVRLAAEARADATGARACAESSVAADAVSAVTCVESSVTADAVSAKTDAGNAGQSHRPRKAKRREEVLLPAIPDCILDIDLAKRRMTVHVLDGLL